MARVSKAERNAFEQLRHESKFEGTSRPLYAALGWLFVWNNVVLATGLIASDAARATYLGGGSFGGENDLVRIARDGLGSGLPVAAMPLLVAAITTPVLAWWLGSIHREPAVDPLD